MEQVLLNDTIAAVSTPPGVGGIAVIRISGPEALSVVNSAWKGCDLTAVPSHTLHFGKYFTIEGNLLDEGVTSVFKAPSSFTGEDVVEISVHGSSWIQRELLNDLVKRGVRIANPGEFTQRAFLNNKLDLAQAEGVADLISSSSKAAHDIAISQTKGTFSKEFDALREKLIEFASLLELELDFSEEDVEFADRSSLVKLCEQILDKVNNLASSYSRGSALKNGVPVVIAGVPNAGKSSLLNLLLGDDKAIVTDIPGTTRDTIEDTIEIDGILYRFIDTAGLRQTEDVVEGIGVERALTALDKAFVVIWVIDPTVGTDAQLTALKEFKSANPSKKLILLINKSDITDSATLKTLEESILKAVEGLQTEEVISFSTLTKQGIQQLTEKLKDYITAGQNPEKDIIVTNARHYEALIKASASLQRALQSLSPSHSTSLWESDPNSSTPDQDSCSSPFETSPLSADFIAQDIREAISHLATITGSITTDNLLHSIFSRFCIGK